MIKYYPATISYYEELLQLVLQFEKEKQTLYDKEDKIDNTKRQNEIKKDLKKYLKDATYNYFICIKNNIPIGYIFSCIADAYIGEGYINEVYVNPTNRNKGIGTKLIKKALAWLKQNNCTTIYLTVNKKIKTQYFLTKILASVFTRIVTLQ